MGRRTSASRWPPECCWTSLAELVAENETASVALLTKMDLAEVVEFEREAALASIESVRPGRHVLEISSKTGQAWWTSWR